MYEDVIREHFRRMVTPCRDSLRLTEKHHNLNSISRAFYTALERFLPFHQRALHISLWIASLSGSKGLFDRGKPGSLSFWLCVIM